MDNNYFTYIFDEWVKEQMNPYNINENERLIKTFIINDLKKIGVDITKIRFHVKVYGLQKINVKIFYRDEFTRSVMMDYTKKQLERKTKLDSMLDD